MSHAELGSAIAMLANWPQLSRPENAVIMSRLTRTITAAVQDAEHEIKVRRVPTADTFDPRAWLLRQRGCKIYVAQPNFSDPKGRSLFDADQRENQYAVHYYVQGALAAHPWRTYNRSAADVIFFNASFSFRHELRIPARELLWRESRRVQSVDDGCQNSTWPLVFATEFTHHTSLPRMPKNVHLIRELRAGPNHLVAPFVVASPAWLVRSSTSDETAGRAGAHAGASEARRQLVLFGGHIPKLYISSTRYLIWRQLYLDPRATVFAATLCRMRGMASCDKSDAELLRGDDLFLQNECLYACSPQCPCERRRKQKCLDQPRMRSGGLAFYRAHCEKQGFMDPFLNFTATFRAAGQLAAVSHRLDRTEYLRQAMRHRFCIVAPGDYASTAKITEGILIAAAGGCLPLLVVDSSNFAAMPFPFADRVNYCSVAFIVHRAEAERRMPDVLRRLSAVDASERARRQRNAEQLLPAFVSRQGSSLGAPSAAEMAIADMCALARDRQRVRKKQKAAEHGLLPSQRRAGCVARRPRTSAWPLWPAASMVVTRIERVFATHTSSGSARSGSRTRSR